MWINYKFGYIDLDNSNAWVDLPNYNGQPDSSLKYNDGSNDIYYRV